MKKIDIRKNQPNAFELLALASKLSRARGDDKAKWKEINARMTNGDYFNLVRELQREFVGLVEVIM